MSEVRYADVDDRAMDRGGFHSAVAHAVPSADERARREEQSLGRQCDLLADWLEKEPNWDANVRSCEGLIWSALRMAPGPKRLAALRVALETTRRLFPRAPHPGERDALC